MSDNVFASRFKALRTFYSFSQEQMAGKLHTSKQVISRYETGLRIPKITVVQSIADEFGINMTYFLDDTLTEEEQLTYLELSLDDNRLDKATKKQSNLNDNGTLRLVDDKLVSFPVIGRITAGYNGIAEEEYTGEAKIIPISSLRHDPSEYFVLAVSGDSMYPRILDGDYILVHRQSDVTDGKVAVIIYNGDEATVKKVNRTKNGIDLIPFNPEFQIKSVTGPDLEQCRILGEAVELIRKM